MGIQISFNTGELTTEDRDVIALAIGVTATAPAAAAPAAAPAKKATAKKAAAKPAPEPEPEPEDEDLLGGDEDEAPTMADAVAAATERVGNGQGAEVKAALTAVGVKRVSELKPTQIADFLAALD